MKRYHRGVLLADLFSKFELLLEDYATLHAEVQALHRAMHERHELGLFPLETIAVDLAGHRTDQALHPRCWPLAPKRPGRRAAHPFPVHLPD